MLTPLFYFFYLYVDPAPLPNFCADPFLAQMTRVLKEMQHEQVEQSHVLNAQSSELKVQSSKLENIEKLIQVQSPSTRYFLLRFLLNLCLFFIHIVIFFFFFYTAISNHPQPRFKSRL